MGMCLCVVCRMCVCLCMCICLDIIPRNYYQQDYILLYILSPSIGDRKSLWGKSQGRSIACARVRMCECLFCESISGNTIHEVTSESP